MRIEHQNNRGFTSVEALIAIVVLLVLLGAIMSTFYQSQKLYTSQHDLIEASQAGRVAMNQIQSFLRQAGNDPNNIGLTPITVDNANQITIRSDVTGAVPAASSLPMEATGEADGTLTNLYEQVIIRYDPGAKELFINVGNGEQSLAENVPVFNWTFYDVQGNVTNDGNEIAKAHVELAIESENPDQQTGSVNSVTLESEVMVRTQSYQFFSYVADQNHVTP
jgi:type II secretory pathway pseudopilin PulG